MHICVCIYIYILFLPTLNIFSISLVNITGYLLSS